MDLHNSEEEIPDDMPLSAFNTKKRKPLHFTNGKIISCKYNKITMFVITGY